jgi:hypothetical protein
MAYNSHQGVAIKRIMISINDFKLASFEKKCEHVTTQTNYIASRSDLDMKVYLYHAGKYFIEVYYSPSSKRVLVIQAFNEPASLLPYVEMVSLDDLSS